MDFAINSADFARILSNVKGCIPQREMIPVLQHVLIEAGAGLVTVRATDRKMEAVSGCAADVKVDGALTVPGNTLLDLVKRFPKCELVTLEKWGKNDSRVRLMSGRSKYALPTLEAEEFPKMLEAEGVALSPPAAVLKMLLTSTVGSAAPDSDNRVYLQGVFLHAKEGRLAAVATDGHRVVYRETPALEAPDDMPSVIVPRAAVNLIVAALGSSEGNVDLIISNTRLTIRAGGLTLTAKLLDGEFPHYERLFPPINGATFTAKPGTLIDALERAKVVANAGVGAVGIALDDKGVRILAGAKIGDVDEAEESVDAEVKATLPEIGVSARYLDEALRLWPDVPIDVQQEGPGSPILMTAKECPELRCVVMPMRR